MSSQTFFDTVSLRPRSAPAALAALYAAAWVAVVLVGVQLVARLFSGIPWAFSFQYPNPFDYLGSLALDLAGTVAIAILPFAVGVFLTLWLLTPVESGMRLPAILWRGAVAALVGGLLAAVFALVVQAIGGWWAPPVSPWPIALSEAVARAASWAPVVILVLVVRAWWRPAPEADTDLAT